MQIENRNLTPESREEYEARIVFEVVKYKPTRVDAEWDGEQWTVLETKEEVEESRTVMHDEIIASGEQSSTHATFEAAIFKVNTPPTLEMKKKQLGLLIKAIAYGYNTMADALSVKQRQMLEKAFEDSDDEDGHGGANWWTILRNGLSEFAAKANRDCLVNRDDVTKLTELLYEELKVS